MSHMVVFRSTDGRPGYHQAEGIDDAIKFVERLRNQENITEARIFRMQEVPIEFKTYYRVEVNAGSTDSAPATVPETDPETETAAEGDAAAAGAGSGRFGRFSK